MPAKLIKEAMNAIQRAQRLRIAAVDEAEASKVSDFMNIPRTFCSLNFGMKQMSYF